MKTELGVARKSKNTMKQRSIFVLILCHLLLQFVDAQVAIPPRYDGFVYRGGHQGDPSDSIAIEAFFDPTCPDSRDSWPPLKQALKYYSHRVSLIAHPFPLPYHDNSYASCRALHIANRLNASTTYHLLELFFKNQENFYNGPTHNMSRASVLADMAKLVAKAVGSSSLPEIESGFKDRNTDLTTRVSFKYGCSRGVTGTPYFLVNGFPLSNAGSALDYNKWRSIIDPLLGAKKETREEPLHYFL